MIQIELVISLFNRFLNLRISTAKIDILKKSSHPSWNSDCICLKFYLKFLLPHNSQPMITILRTASYNSEWPGCQQCTTVIFCSDIKIYNPSSKSSIREIFGIFFIRTGTDQNSLNEYEYYFTLSKIFYSL